MKRVYELPIAHSINQKPLHLGMRTTLAQLRMKTRKANLWAERHLRVIPKGEA